MWDPTNYTYAALLLPRLLGMIYFFAIGAFIFQIKGLLGQSGILPAKDYLNQMRLFIPKKRFFYIPSLFWLNANDGTLMGMTIAGTVISTLLMFGYFPPLCLGLLFLIYLSIVSVGQDFLSFGWESLLLEITFYTFFVTLTPIPNFLAWINLNFLLIRFHIHAGTVKLKSHDPAWRNLTAIAFHYQSQPLPNTCAWFAYKCPLGVHKASAALLFILEMVVPLGLFLTDDIRAIAGTALIGLQFLIWLTGNFSFLNYLTAAFCIIAFNNEFLSLLIQPPEIHPSRWIFEIFLSIVAAGFIGLQILRFWQEFLPLNKYLKLPFRWLAPWHLVNRFGLFAIMTTIRDEIVLEGSVDGKIWEEYLFRFKPSEINRRPRRVSPYQPRIDWQMWFLPFEDFEEQTWFHRFLYCLLKGTPEVLYLLRHNPFPNVPPKYIRALKYNYRFSSWNQLRASGEWWQREFIEPFGPILSLYH